jgi:N-ethylmaleimide reductase
MSDTHARSLHTPVRLGRYDLPNRLVMAPLTRSRAHADGVPSDMARTYYEQRASAGLIISEGAQISAQAIGYPNTPGIYTDAQVAGWRPITDAVHARGGRIFLQLWHVGRISHPSMQPDGALPVAPSAVAPAGVIYTSTGPQPYVAPRALETAEIAGVVADYANGARRALEAGFDGVEIHGANGYLIDQFLRDGTNQRTDQYGGSLENRTRFLLEVTQAVVDVAGADRVGVRFSPLGVYGPLDSDPQATFAHATQALGRFGLAYLHVIDPVDSTHRMASPDGARVAPQLRALWTGPFIVNGGYDRATGDAVIATGAADLVAFGIPFLANPDLVERFAEDAPLNTPDAKTFYSGGAAGYVDYPTRDAARTAATSDGTATGVAA